MDTKMNIDLSIEGTTIAHFNSFTLKQAFNEHHYFELRFNHDQMGEPGMITLEDSKGFMGKNLTIQFGVDGGGAQQTFTGKVTKVELAQSHGYHGIIIVSGFSPTILIDRGPDMGSYLAKDLSTIVRQATQDAPSNDLRISLNPSRTGPIDYIIQYRESDFDFINRLSAEYFEWFYYDGVQLNFGKPAQQANDVQLTYGRDLHALQYAMQVAPLKYKKFAYQPLEDQLLSSESNAPQGGQPDLSYAVQASNTVYSKVYSQPTPIRIDSKSDIDSHVQNESSALVSDLLRISGGGNNPLVQLGGTVNVDMSVRQDADFTTQNLGRFLVTTVFHQFDGLGHYYNSFEAVVADTQHIPVRSYQKPEPDLQLGIVLDNNDPKNQGRVKVTFKWDCTSNDPTEWLRVASPNAGKGDAGSNRGFMVVPEVGDQVVIGFEEGNIARPVVLGCVYHGNNVDSSGFTNSNTKAMTSRKGSTLTFNDASHALNLQTTAANTLQILEQQGAMSLTAAKSVLHQSGNNTILVHSEDNSITLTADTTITLTSGKGSITIHKDGTISIKGEIVTVEAKNNHIKGESKLDGGNVFIN
ncbi:type VI secretion system Vgr family protein [Dinghuibacter silviterrae]|uniref:Uncharacterized protein involved in type VI secretion and phage assembly n=1 Tax=Dinghuibacter silviterrae TaxID=1539049 RepID=A0A4R8DHS9_9BACT|nr:type VI secretion system Vgr family protein [Dinghuibacter silviterrae]TDW96814.1 uncharacterized protein involved in type VI secretion and phage assembly [Dinghuibacter silviterrae]